MTIKRAHKLKTADFKKEAGSFLCLNYCSEFFEPVSFYIPVNGDNIVKYHCLGEIFGVTGKKTLPVIAIFKKIENYFQKLILNPDFAVAFRPADCRNRPFSVVSDGYLSSAAH